MQSKEIIGFDEAQTASLNTQVCSVHIVALVTVAV